MTSFQCIVFLTSLSMLSLIALGLLFTMDLANIAVKQKVTLLKLSISIIITAPFIFCLLRLFALPGLVITLPTQAIYEKATSITQILPSDNNISWSFYLLLTYGIIVCMLLLQILISYLKAKQQLKISYQACIQGQVVFINKNIKTPLTFGLPKAKIYFPLHPENKWTAREIQLSLAHEKNHVEQNDALWKLLSLIAQSLLFFSPWAYYLHKRFELETEILCDAHTCQAAGADFREYGNLLLAMTCIQSTNMVFNNLSDSTLKRRVLAMKRKTCSNKFLTAILCGTLFFAGSTAIALTSGMAANHDIFKITIKMLIDGNVTSNPVIVARENQKAIIMLGNTNNTGSQSLRIAIVARNVTSFGFDDKIGINCDIVYKDNQKDLHMKSQMVVIPRQSSKIHLPSDVSHSYDIDIIAERINN